MNGLIIVLGIVIVILGYVLYTSYQSKPVVKLMDLGKSSNTPIPTSTYPTVGTSTRYAYGVWIYMNQLGQTTGQIYPIFYTRKGGVGAPSGTPKFDTGNSASANANTENFTFIVYLDANVPKLHCGIWTQGTEVSLPETGNPDTKDVFHAMITDNFTLQRWVYLVISVDNTFVDLYLDGKLVKSVKMANLPYQDTNNVVNTTITADMAKSLNAINFGRLPGTYIANFQRWETPLDPQSVWNYYMQGNGQSSKLLNYNVNLDFIKNDKLTSQWNLL